MGGGVSGGHEEKSGDGQGYLERKEVPEILRQHQTSGESLLWSGTHNGSEDVCDSPHLHPSSVGYRVHVDSVCERYRGCGCVFMCVRKDKMCDYLGLYV